MRFNPKHDVTDPAVVRRLIAENPWATLVSQTSGGLVASHYPVLLDDSSDVLAVVTHVGRPDEQVHDFRDSEILLIIAGAHGYVSPSWYAEGATPAPTWNFSVAHCYGVPEALDAETNIRVLTRLVAHFENRVDRPRYLTREVADRLSPGTLGLRIPITRFVCKVKMSQDKDPVSQHNVLEHLRRPGPYSHPILADDMERALSGRQPTG
jgi:transcriptional regulator